MLREQFNAILKRHRWSELFPPVAHHDDRIIYLEDTTKHAYLGACFYGYPLFGADESSVNQLKSVLSADFPPGTYIQFGLLAHSDVLDPVMEYEERKRFSIASSNDLSDNQKRMLWESTTSRADFFRRGVTKPMMKNDNKRLTKQMLIVSIKVKCKTSPEDSEFAAAEEIFSRFHNGLNSIGMSLLRADARDYLALVRAVIQPSKPLDFGYDNLLSLRDQILEPGFSMIRGGKKHLDINGKVAKVLSVKRLPDRTNLGIMNFIMGDPSGLSAQMPGNWYAAYTLHYPDQQDAQRKVRNRHTLLVQQASGPLGRLVPRLRIKQEGFDVLIEDLDRGGILVEAQLNLIVYGEDKAEANKAAATMSTYLSSYRLELVEDSMILEALLTNHLPLFPSEESCAMMRRMRTLTIRQALCFCPVIGEWPGQPNVNAMILNTRRGQVYGFDLYNSKTNYNGIVFAESGAGKSYFTQQMILDYLSEGATVWVVDIGRSYYKLCKALESEFIEFSDSSGICLNPFTHVEDIGEDLAMFEDLLAKMCAPDQGLTDYQRVQLNAAIKSVFSSRGTTMTITDVAEFCTRHDDPRIRDLGAQLHNYTRSGMFGHWFDGENNLQFNGKFTVLELEELNGKPQLQKIVLMMLMAKIEKEMYLNRDGKKKIVIFDESWALFSDPGVAKFMQHGFRRFRKYDGAAVLVLQNILDFYRQEGMEPIAENAAHKIVLKQQTASIDATIAEQRISLDPYGVNLMKSIHTVPGWYSEIMFMKDQEYSVGVLKTPPFASALFATKGRESTEAIERIRRGENAVDVIKSYVNAEGDDDE